MIKNQSLLIFEEFRGKKSKSLLQVPKIPKK